MAGDDEDLRLNTLHRFAKHSPRLVLHEYSSCEIPAGCGGVVMRWYDPAEGAPATVRLDAPGLEEVGTWLDGVPLASSMTAVRAGGHLLGLHAKRTKPGPQPFTLGVYYDADRGNDLLAGGGPRWCMWAKSGPPPAGWAAPGFDDARWAKVPRAKEKQLAALETWQRQQFDEAARTGRPLFSVERDEMWLRVTFTARAVAR